MTAGRGRRALGGGRRAAGGQTKLWTGGRAVTEGSCGRAGRQAVDGRACGYRVDGGVVEVLFRRRFRNGSLTIHRERLVLNDCYLFAAGWLMLLMLF